VLIASNFTGNRQMCIIMALEKSRNHLISRLCHTENILIRRDDKMSGIHQAMKKPRKMMVAFRRHMPRRDQEAAGLRLMQNKKNATLEDFLFD